MWGWCEVVRKISIQDDGIGKVKIMLDDQEVTDGLTSYKIEHVVGTELPVLTLQYVVKDVEFDGACVTVEVQHENS